MVMLVTHAYITPILAIQIHLLQEISKMAAHNYLLVLPVASELSLNIVLKQLSQFRLGISGQSGARFSKMEQRLAWTNEFAEASHTGLGLLAQHQLFQLLIMRTPSHSPQLF